MRGEAFPRTRKKVLACLAFPCLMACICAGFLAAVSIWVGLSNIDRAGFWVPVLAGIALLTAAVWIFTAIIGAFIRSRDEEDSLIV